METNGIFFARTQKNDFISWLLIGIIGVILITQIFSSRSFISSFVLVVISSFVCVSIVITLQSMTIIVDQNYVKLILGIGVIRRTFLISDIDTIEPYTLSRFHSYGVHYTTSGLLYSISGNMAVRIKLKNGRVYLLGTDQPQELIDAINESKEENAKE